MGKIRNRIERNDLEPGDHIYAHRGPLYTHHGIYIGKDMVIHYNRTQADTSNLAKPCIHCMLDRNQHRGVVKSCVGCFLNGHHLCRFRYGVSCLRFATNLPGSCTTGPPIGPDDTISRATQLLMKDIGAFGDYHFLDNNCETFAIFCKTGNPVSKQADLAKAGSEAIKKIAKDILHKGLKSGFKSALKAPKEVIVNRLLLDVLAHYGQETCNQLKQSIHNDGCLTKTLLKQFKLPQDGHHSDGDGDGDDDVCWD